MKKRKREVDGKKRILNGRDQKNPSTEEADSLEKQYFHKLEAHT